MKTVGQVNELQKVIFNYYAQKATEEMDQLWKAGLLEFTRLPLGDEWRYFPLSERKNQGTQKQQIKFLH